MKLDRNAVNALLALDDDQLRAVIRGLAARSGAATDMLRISQETLDDMTDLQLLFATADYPYFCDVSMYGFNQEGFDTFSAYCSAFDELQSRKSFLKTLKTYGKPVAQLYLSDPNNTLDIARADLILGMMEFYLGARPEVIMDNGYYFVQ